ncbi:MAG: hypothetical protein PVH61_23915 [Candidatus Aminicenantes bacterium]|jgi:WD40 repeat protein
MNNSKNFRMIWLLIVGITVLLGCSQTLKQPNWCFGEHCGLNFPLGGGQIPNGNPAIMANEACITQSDESGNLLFYSDGTNLWNSAHISVNSSLGGHHSTSQNIVIPRPGYINEYFLLIPPASEQSSLNLRYAHIEVNGGTVTVLDQGIILKQPVKYWAEAITAIQSKGNGYWVIVYGGMDPGNTASNDLYVIAFNELTAGNLSNVQFFKQNENIHHYRKAACLKASPDCRYIALTGHKPTNAAGIALYQFDYSTGEIVGEKMISTSGDITYSCSFSPNSNHLYFLNGYFYNDNEIQRYNLTSDSIDWSSIDNYVRGMQLGPDGQIYLARIGNNFLSRINNPNMASPTVTAQAISYTNWQGSIVKLRLPNMIDAKWDD